MSEITKDFSIEYETGSKTGTFTSDTPTTAHAIVPAALEASTEPAANVAAPDSVETGTSSTANLLAPDMRESGMSSTANVAVYDIDKPRRIVTRGKIEHEPQG